MSQKTKKPSRPAPERAPSSRTATENPKGRHLVEDENLLQRAYYAVLRFYRRSRRRWRHIVREKHAHNFPESERLPIKLLLFVWSATWGKDTTSCSAGPFAARKRTSPGWSATPCTL